MAEILRGKIVANKKLTGKISGEKRLTGRMIVTGYDSSEYPFYSVDEEDYFITPSVSEQVLSTKHKRMKDDLTVEAIPYQEVTNLSGGKTATIGGY